jgi:hypothetical protein
MSGSEPAVRCCGATVESTQGAALMPSPGCIVVLRGGVAVSLMVSFV